MVFERVITHYACEICQKEYLTWEKAAACETMCRRLAASSRLEKLNFSPRVFNALSCAGVYTVGELEKFSDEELLKIKGFGRQSLVEVRGRLEEYRVLR